MLRCPCPPPPAAQPPSHAASTAGRPLRLPHAPRPPVTAGRAASPSPVGRSPSRAPCPPRAGCSASPRVVPARHRRLRRPCRPIHLLCAAVGKRCWSIELPLSTNLSIPLAILRMTCAQYSTVLLPKIQRANYTIVLCPVSDFTLSPRTFYSVPEIARAVPVFIDETVKLSKAYFEAAKANNCRVSILEEVAVEHIKADITSDVTRIITSLSDGIKELAVKKMRTCFAGHLEGYSKNHRVISLPTSSWGVAGLPVHAVASALQRCEIKADCIIDEKSITTMFKFTISLINMYGTASDNTKYHLAKNISSMLDIISNTRHLSMWDLYHSLLKERHWPLIHLAMDSFGYFAARTSFTQLWKFVPGDAALSYNASTGTSIDENGFMLELRAYLQKEVALHTDRWSAEEQICFLVSEGRALKKLVEAYSEIPVVEPEKAVITTDVGTKKRKMPDGICEGMVLLQNGLKVMRTAFDEAEFAVLKDQFAAHLSRLEETVSQIASLSDEI
ncbi:hypothetical protein PR202_gb18574 [Eleusine coracana subsp. coracana]|uniref:Uncharacterized protein n=1 Tax=Eleusine coracana subsp. coracana TaxID=191504 RepID=A0AAV5F5Z6_ELECO|nr:hypothetical protein PR202_gb18574 [Eleusine coracana subsp. coracana]